MTTLGKSTYLAVGTAATPATAVRIDDKLMSIAAFDESIDQTDVTTFGQDWKLSRGTLRDGGTVSVEGPYVAALWTHLSALRGVASVRVEYGPVGNGVGAPKLSADCFLTSISITTAVGDVVKISAEFKVSGAVTTGTF